MAVIIQTSFEDYPDGIPPNEEDSLSGEGWTPGGGGTDIGVVSSGAHTGGKAVLAPNGALQWPSGYQGRSVTMEAWFNIDATPPVSGPNLQINSSLGSDGITRWPLQAFRESPSGDLVVYVMDVEIGRQAGVFTAGIYQKFRLQAKFSTVNDDGDDLNTDGCVSVYVDDVLVLSLTDQKVGVTSVNWGSGENEYEYLYWQAVGYIDDVYAFNDEITCGGLTDTDPPPDDSTPCCGSGPGPDNPNPSSTPNPGDPPIPLQPWTPQCAGGGTVPFASDVTDLESWAL